MKHLNFSINRISASALSYVDFLAMCQRLNVKTIEIRNDLPNCEISDGTPAATIKAATEAAGIEIYTINALYPFDVFNADLAARAKKMAQYAKECGAKALVMCPYNEMDDKRSERERYQGLVASLKALKPILEDHGIFGLIEPLGFTQCALRKKSDAVKAIYEAGVEKTYRLVHDTFHHYLAEEDIFYPDLTGLVHISGVEDASLANGAMRDAHRILVGKNDRLGNMAQLKTLIARGYQGVISFEPFADEIQQAKDGEKQLLASMNFIKEAL